ncbi:endonuclease [Marinimicrobium sp. C6131]|uniref:Z1 domain-containing protein n=1 Tax=Marinimicrobium sp. C6131 TaxID=3022676 RepID=UPI00223E7BC2|nr:Z1 domain-containing protein [Marinimicrobium sp. C6131]UZJ44239.1 endonuclease [Marinimicrobium sp. C6131]
MTAIRNEKEKGLTRALITAFEGQEEVPKKADIEARARQLAPLLGYSGDLRLAVEEAMIAIDTWMGAGVSLVDNEAYHDEEWVYKRDIEWTYSDAYEGYLKNEKWQPSLVQRLSDVGSKILGQLQDPTCEGSWNRRGLVIGHVQSGKTANYMGVIAKAADAGYKFIIVIAGIHNNLRKQTQERIDEGFIGRSSDPENRVTIGVGRERDYPYPATLTNINEDFSKNTAAKSGWKINDFGKPIILVIKKNVRTLEALHKWLKELNAQGDGRISDVPMLLIDDEADNASINTNKEDISPTRTNAMIRRILGLFAKSCYVGYTATPFANIFINPDAYDDDVREELFPRDFIYSLDAPNTYFGPEKVFLDEESSSAVLQAITDCEDYLPFSHKKDDAVVDLPSSLYRAMDQFIVARAIRNLRGHSEKHCSMMINISRFVSIQQEVRNFISIREKKIREAVKANYMMPEEVSSRNHYMISLREVFESEYSTCGFEWDEVKTSLMGVFESLRVFVVNSKSDEVLDFKKYERDGVGLTAIAIGGLSLSRGLTIEGLTISYMYRNTRMYDTLMQMGRWFGYRPGFEDLCRVYLSEDSINWYSHIAEASEELREQIKRMRRDGMSPRQFGLYVQSHPDRLLITAANKMRTGEEVVFNQNLTGSIKESTRLPVDSKVNAHNEALIQEFWRSGFGAEVKETQKGWFVPDVSVDQISDFVTRFRVHSGMEISKKAVLDYLYAISKKFPHGDVLLIANRGLGDAGKFMLEPQRRSAKNATPSGWILSGYRLASRGDEKLGLADVQLEQAEKQAENDPNSKANKPSDIHYRTVRNKPLLMIHVLEPVDTELVELKGQRVPAFGVSFPNDLFGTEIKVVANRVWVEQMYGSFEDDPDAEDDYDD